jgi:aerobic-type carbon monoxide dehydrogenase small subunit (CoxS/CutS family)
MANLTINGEQKSFDAPPDMPLLWVLRDILGLTGTKFGCGIAQCGACTAHIDGKPVRSCMLPVGAVRDRAVTTIEGIGETPIGARVQRASLDLEVTSAGIANRARSCRRRHCSQQRPIQMIPTSTRQWRETSVAAAPMCGLAPPSSKPPPAASRRRTPSVCKAFRVTFRGALR